MAKTILIAEDELAQLFRQVLVIGGEGKYQVESAETGPEAVRMAKVLKPDLIIMDLRLPRMSGLEAIRRIRKFNKRVPIIAVTAYADRYTQEQAKDAGANEYIAKPFDTFGLLCRISELLSGGQ